ncbi:MAG: beta-N-acetylhexosaminidase, partial [Deltaproteobacteria bacterium]|nr:beta-N-acetylhexosaminidase [Deltaproteobacteria bacterium]
HVVYPALDPERPATLSPAIVTQLLREEIGYEGVVFGDDMEMKAISQNFSFDEAVTLSIQAGVDVLLYGH